MVHRELKQGYKRYMENENKDIGSTWRIKTRTYMVHVELKQGYMQYIEN